MMKSNNRSTRRLDFDDRKRRGIALSSGRAQCIFRLVKVFLVLMTACHNHGCYLRTEVAAAAAAAAAWQPMAASFRLRRPRRNPTATMRGNNSKGARISTTMIRMALPRQQGQQYNFNTIHIRSVPSNKNDGEECKESDRNEIKGSSGDAVSTSGSRSSSSSSSSSSWQLSPSLAAHVEQVRAEMGHVFLNPNDPPSEGVACTGEPSVDPSRQVRANQGDSEWMDDW